MPYTLVDWTASDHHLDQHGAAAGEVLNTFLARCAKQTDLKSTVPCLRPGLAPGLLPGQGARVVGHDMTRVSHRVEAGSIAGQAQGSSRSFSLPGAPPRPLRLASCGGVADTTGYRTRSDRFRRRGSTAPRRYLRCFIRWPTVAPANDSRSRICGPMCAGAQATTVAS
jgi:hypothetical protein